MSIEINNKQLKDPLRDLSFELMKQRELSFDIARAFCMLYIIGVWHFDDYLPCENHFILKYGNVLTICVLASFTYISGFFMGKKHLTVSEFYLNRLKRFYILFFIASILMFLWKDPLLFVKTITGVSNFVTPYPTTLWYISMLMVFYFVTPVLTCHKKEDNGSVAVAFRGIIFFSLSFSLKLYLDVDDRFPFYFVFYVLGLITSQKVLNFIVVNNLSMCFICIFLFIIVLPLALEACMDDIATYEIAAVGVLIVLTISTIIKSYLGKRCAKVISLISYSSMCAYLFHRIIYGVISRIIDVSWAWSPIFVAIIIAVSYYIQKGYDRLFTK